MNSPARYFVLAFAAAILLAGASSASADTILNYQISGPGSFNASFTLPQNPTPSGGNQLAFDFASLPVDVNGTWTNLTVFFYSSAYGGGVLGSNTFNLYGQQLFTWPASSTTPTMDIGTFHTIGVATGSGLGLYTVNVTDPPAAVPEPASVFLLGMGLLTLFGFRLRRRFA
jgi:PEP-CTERM motif-containing protein